jgi:hypothetical protein
MTFKGFIINIGRGLNGNKQMSQIFVCHATNVYSPQQNNIHMFRMIETMHNQDKTFRP